MNYIKMNIIEYKSWFLFMIISKLLGYNIQAFVAKLPSSKIVQIILSNLWECLS